MKNNSEIMHMFVAPDPEADTTEQSADTKADTAKYKRRAHNHAPDTRPDTPDTATFSIWPLVVSICVSAVAYFTEKQARIRTIARPRAEDYKAQWRGRAQRRRGFWGSLRLRYTQNAYAHKKAKRSGEAERSGEGGFWGLPRLRYNTTRPRAQQAKHSGEEEFLRLQFNTARARHEGRTMARTRANSNSPRRFSSKFSALGTPAKPNRDVLRNSLLCSMMD